MSRFLLTIERELPFGNSSIGHRWITTEFVTRAQTFHKSIRQQFSCEIGRESLHKCKSPKAKFQEDVNGEKPTVKKWWIFGADFFTVWCPFFHGLRRFFTVYKGHERWKKNFSLLMIFFTVSFSRFTPPLDKSKVVKWNPKRPNGMFLVFLACFRPQAGSGTLR